MDDKHYHYDCPLCSEEAIKERCPAFKIEWTLSLEKRYVMKDIRMWFLDGTYMDVNIEEFEYYQCDAQLKSIEFLNKCMKDIDEENI